MARQARRTCCSAGDSSMGPNPVSRALGVVRADRRLARCPRPRHAGRRWMARCMACLGTVCWDSRSVPIQMPLRGGILIGPAGQFLGRGRSDNLMFPNMPWQYPGGVESRKVTSPAFPAEAKPLPRPAAAEPVPPQPVTSPASPASPASHVRTDRDAIVGTMVPKLGHADHRSCGSVRPRRSGLDPDGGHGSIAFAGLGLSHHRRRPTVRPPPSPI